MLIGGSHKEWPEEYDWFMPAWREGESKMEKEYEEWLWEQVLEDGPPQSDDVTWLKKHVAYMTASAAILTNRAGGRALTTEDAAEVGVTGARELQKKMAQL